MKTVNLNFDGVSEECFVEYKADEIVCHTKDGRFEKFPLDVDFKAAVKAYNAANAEVPEFADEEADAAAAQQAAELAAWKG